MLPSLRAASFGVGKSLKANTVSSSNETRIPTVDIRSTASSVGNIVYNIQNNVPYYGTGSAWLPLGVNGIPISQENFGLPGGVFTIPGPGLYYLTENVTGNIVFGSDCCVLNLNNFDLTVLNGTTGITALNREDITIGGGCISGAGTVAGERAIRCDTVTGLKIINCQISGFLSRSTGIVQLDTCKNLLLNDINITGCTKTLAAPVSPGFGFLDDIAPRLLSMSGCSNFRIDGINVNANIQDSIQSFNFFCPFGLTNSNNGYVSNVQINNNIIVNGGVAGMFGYSLGTGCHNIYTKQMQVCYNDCQDPLAFFIGAASFDLTFQGSNLVLDEYVSASNRAATLFPGNPLGNTVLCGTAWGFGASSCFLLNSNSVGNRVDDGGVVPPGLQSICIGFTVLCDTINCVASNNSMGSTNVGNVVAGIHRHEGSVINCITNNNTGGEFAAGIWSEINVPGFPPFKGGLCQIENCTMNENGGYGFRVYNTAGPAVGNFNGVEIKGCTIVGNVHPTSSSAGISIPSLTSVAKDILIRDCVINGTSSPTAGNSAGIVITNANRVVIEGCTIGGTTAPGGSGDGIALDSVLNCTTSGNELTGNQNQGLLVVGTNAGSVIAGNIFKSNAIGLNFASVIPTTSVVGNLASFNVTNYVAASGVWNIQNLTFSSGTYTQLTGAGAALGSPLANIQMIP